MTRRTAGEGMIRQRPNGLWEARYTASDGRRRAVYAKTRREASDKLRGAIADRDKGLRPVDQRLTVGAYLDDWLEHHVKPNVRPRTLESYTFVADTYLKPNVGRFPLAQLEPEHVAAMLRTLEARKPALSPTTVRYCYVVLRIALGRAHKLGRVHRNVATLIDPPALAQRRVVPMTAEDARAFLASVRGDRLEALYRLAISTGMRQGEILGLRWQDVDLDAGALTVRHTLRRGVQALAEPKTESSRRQIGLDDETVALLRSHRVAQLEARLAEPRWKDGDFVFCSGRGQPVHARILLRCYHEALARAGIARQPFHQLRHGFATLMLENGEELANVSKVLGHSTFSTTVDAYGHLTPTISRRAAARMRDILAG